MDIRILNARLIEDGNVVASLSIGGGPMPVVLYGSDEASFRTDLAMIRAIVLQRELERRRERGTLKAGAAYTIDFTYKYKDNA